jgi:hypothetical protein
VHFRTVVDEGAKVGPIGEKASAEA